MSEEKDYIAEGNEQVRRVSRRKKIKQLPQPGDLPKASRRIVGKIVNDGIFRHEAIEAQNIAREKQKAEDQKTFLKAYRDAFGLPHIAAQKCKISIMRHKYWMQYDKEYNRKVAEIKEFCNEHLQAKMYKNALSGDGQMLRYLDQRRIVAEQNQTLKIAVEHSGTVGCSITTEEELKEKTGFTCNHATRAWKMIVTHNPELAERMLNNQLTGEAPPLRRGGKQKKEQ